MSFNSKRVDLIPAKRHAMIIEHLRARGATSVAELIEATGGSVSTIRRDLEQLEEQGYLERTHGGARLPPSLATFEREKVLNAHLRSEQKIAIGAEAARRLNPRESVICDSSSTVLEAIRVAMTRNIPLTIITNSLDVAQLCGNIPNWQVIMPGGTIRQGMNCLYGEPGHSFFAILHADVCLVGAYAITDDAITDATIDTATLKKAMIKSARKAIVLADSSKFTVPAFLTSCELAEIDEIITDDGIAPENAQAVRTRNVTLTTVPVMPRGDERL